MANLFSYLIKDREGNTAKGVIEAESKEKLIEHFHQQGCIIFSIEEARKDKKLKKRRRVKTDDLVIFSRQFTTLIESRIPALKTFAILL